FANGVGGVVGGILLEATGILKVDVRGAVIAAVTFGLTSLIVATTTHYAVALTALVIGGIANLAATAIGQALVQLRAPADQRGRVVGAYSMIGSGMRTGNGITLGWLGAVLGVSGAVAVGGIALAGGALRIAALHALQGRRGGVVGVYSMIGSGMRTGNGITLGWLGAVLGVSGAVAVGGIALAVGALLIAALIALQGRRERTA